MKPAEVLRALNRLPKKSFGQNFLVDEKVLSDILEASKLETKDTVVEIGPGLGVLTFALAKQVERVIGVEADRDMVDYLRPKLPSNVDLLAGDALQIDWHIDIQGPYKVVANIPYSITSPLLRRIFSLEKKPEVVVLLIQKEVAERLTAKPGNSNRGFLTLVAESNAEIEIVRIVKPGSFYPAPKVDSAVIRLKPKAENEMNEIFWPAVEVAFQHKRQTLVNSLRTVGVTKAQAEEMLNELGLDPMVRPAVLTLEEWIELSKSLQKAFLKE